MDIYVNGGKCESVTVMFWDREKGWIPMFSANKKSSINNNNDVEVNVLIHENCVKIMVCRAGFAEWIVIPAPVKVVATW